MPYCSPAVTCSEPRKCGLRPTCGVPRSVGLRLVQRPARLTRWLTSIRTGTKRSTSKCAWSRHFTMPLPVLRLRSDAAVESATAPRGVGRLKLDKRLHFRPSGVGSSAGRQRRKRCRPEAGSAARRRLLPPATNAGERHRLGNDRLKPVVLFGRSQADQGLTAKKGS